MGLRIAAIADLHVHTHPRGQYKELFARMSAECDVIVIGGDLTDTGLPEEAQLLAEDLASSTVPVAAVFGNHDLHSDRERELKTILGEAGMTFLDEESYEKDGASVVGVKGFGGGFGAYMLNSFGEALDKLYVRESIEEALKLENLIHGKTRTAVVLHYAPIEATVRGEPEALYPFLGSSRLEDVIDRFCPTVVFHGHAHHGTHEGRTMRDIPVYNVSRSVLAREEKEWLVVEI